MAIIYKIENQITKEVYIGQTKFQLNKRWEQHIKEANEALNGTRQSFPLFHRMIIKYGADNFIPIVVEECDESLLDEREQYWIEYYHSYEHGYNSTIGGQNLKHTNTNSRPIIRAHAVSQFDLSGNYIRTFNSAQEAAEAVHVSASNIRKNCNQKSSHSAGYMWQWGDNTTLHRESCVEQSQKHMVEQYDLKQEHLLNTYNSISEASKIMDIPYQSIYQNCAGNSKTAYGYVWKFKEKI